MFNVEIYTDGSCSGNPGVGGYASVILCNGAQKIVKGYCSNITTNNRMELMAVIAAVKVLKAPCKVTVYTDSQPICACAKHNAKWLTQESHKNNDLWMELITISSKGKHQITFKKVAGHKDNELNNLCDKLAREECKKAKHELLGGK